MHREKFTKWFFYFKFNLTTYKIMRQNIEKVYYIAYRFNKSGRLSHVGNDFFFVLSEAESYVKEMVDAGIFDRRNYHPCVEYLFVGHNNEVRG